MKEFVLVRYPFDRVVSVDRIPLRRTNQLMRVETGTHTFDLGRPLDYSPAAQILAVSDTTKETPMIIVFVEDVARSDGRGSTRRIGAKKAKAAKKAKTAKKAKRTTRKAAGKSAPKKSAKRPTKKSTKRAAKKSPKRATKKSPKRATKKSPKRATKRGRRTD